MNTETKLSPSDLADALEGFTGSETFSRWSALSRSVLTEGAQFLADQAGAYWLFDAIDSHLVDKGVTDETEFTSVTLRRGSLGNDAELILDDGNGVVFARQHIEYTDFPLPEIKLFAVFNGQGWTHMLPREY